MSGAPPLPLDDWRRWLATSDHPCALLRAPQGEIEEVLPSGALGPLPDALAPGRPFPPEPLDGGALFLHAPFPFLGEGWYWVAPQGGDGGTAAAFGLFHDRAPVPFFLLDERRHLLRVNAPFREFLDPARIQASKEAPGDLWDGYLDRAFSGETLDLETDTLFHRRTGNAYRLVLVPLATAPGRAPRLVLGAFWDITELHRALGALRESEARFRTFFDCSPEGLLTLSADGFVLQANRLVCAISGVPLERLRSRHFLTFFPEEERARVTEVLRRAGESGATLRTETRYQHPEDGAWLHLYLVVVPLRDLGAERFLMLLQDRTRMRLLESRAEVQERRYEELFQSSPDAIFTCLTDGTLLTFNRKAAQLFGWGEGAVGRRLAEDPGALPWPLVAGWAGQVAERARRDAGALRTTSSFADAGGLKRTFLVFAIPYTDHGGRPVGLSVHLHDETESRLLQERLADSREQFRSLVENSADLVFQTTPDWRVLYVNPAARTLLGVNPDDLLGRPLKPARFLPKDHWRRIRRLGVEALQREGLRGEVLRVRRADGTEFWARLSLVPILQERRLRSVLGLLRDVDDLFRAQEQLEKQAAALRQTVHQLEEAGRVQEQFVANVTHELRTPLTTILVTSEVMERALDEAAPAPQRRQLALIRSNARILQELINDLLDMAKLKHGHYLPVARAFPLASLVKGLRENMEPLFAQKGLTLEARVSPSAPRELRTDGEMLRKVLANLLSNACKFTERGGATFEVEAAGDRLVFRITDTGIGIAPQDLPRIFEEFRQLDSSDARRQPGTGLGLSIADRFTALLGGRIDVTSAPGCGTVFTVVLPLPPDAGPP